MNHTDTASTLSIKTEKGLLSKKELLEIFVHHRVDSPFPGDWESIFKGSGYEFWALRELERTDPFKNIDWKATAKTGKYYVREYLAESYFNLMILYDISPSVSFGRKELLQANIAASLAYTAAVSNDGCGLITFADRVISYIPPKMGWSHFMEIITAIAQAKPVDCQRTNISHALDKLVNELPESLTFILSDFLYPFESDYSFQRTTHGASKHEVKAFQILEEFEMTLPPASTGLITLYDYESGQSVLLDLSKWQNYNQEMRNRLEGIRHQLTKAGIDLLLLTPADDFRLKIKAFMQRPM
ncbi:MAG: DUF58 domain-containing protein [Desulfobacterales bacterium]|nr:MAG: DUF58 domain-containing protein [Desulfobacterales bacterium]